MRSRKEHIFIIGLAVILVVIVITVAVIALTASSQTTTLAPSPTPSGITTTPDEEEATNPPYDYNPSAGAKLLDRKEDRRALSESDQAAKNRILSLLPDGEVAGILYQTSNFNVEYIEALDVIKVEILTANIDLAKNEASAWFRSQGVSQDGVCNYPIEFYLSFDVGESLQNSGYVFSPLAPGC